MRFTLKPEKCKSNFVSLGQPPYLKFKLENKNDNDIKI